MVKTDLIIRKISLEIFIIHIKYTILVLVVDNLFDKISPILASGVPLSNPFPFSPRVSQFQYFFNNNPFLFRLFF